MGIQAKNNTAEESDEMATPRSRPSRSASLAASEKIKKAIGSNKTSGSNSDTNVRVTRQNPRKSEKQAISKNRKRQTSTHLSKIFPDGDAAKPPEVRRWVEILRSQEALPVPGHTATSTQTNFEAASLTEMKELSRKIDFLEARIEQIEGCFTDRTEEITGPFMMDVEQGVQWLAAPPNAPLAERLRPAVYLEELQKQFIDYDPQRQNPMFNNGYSAPVQQEGMDYRYPDEVQRGADFLTATNYPTTKTAGKKKQLPRLDQLHLDPSQITLVNPSESTINVSALSENQLWGHDHAEEELNHASGAYDNFMPCVSRPQTSQGIGDQELFSEWLGTTR